MIRNKFRSHPVGSSGQWASSETPKRSFVLDLLEHTKLTIQLIGQRPCNRIYGTGVEFSMTYKEEVPTLRLQMHSLTRPVSVTMSESSRKLCDASANHYRHQAHQSPNLLLTRRRHDFAESDAVQEHEAGWEDHASRNLDRLPEPAHDLTNASGCSDTPPPRSGSRASIHSKGDSRGRQRRLCKSESPTRNNDTRG